jgi:hypothetical protein
MTKIKRKKIRLHLCLSVALRLPADYTKFSHATQKHQAACSTCHRSADKDWATSAFRTSRIIPSHDACVSCHRPQFFKGARPPICSVCHSKTSPRDEVRYAFRNPASKLQFAIEFPHDKAPGRDCVQLRFAHAQQNYNNCTICHASRTATFKAVPTNHGRVSTVIGSRSSQSPPTAMAVTSLRLRTCRSPIQRDLDQVLHEGGGEKKQHVAECTTCHINITKAASLRGLKPDVPITACTECHNKDGLRQDLSKELVAIDKNRNFTCVLLSRAECRKSRSAGESLPDRGASAAQTQGHQ